MSPPLRGNFAFWRAEFDERNRVSRSAQGQVKFVGGNGIQVDDACDRKFVANFPVWFAFLEYFAQFGFVQDDDRAGLAEPAKITTHHEGIVPAAAGAGEYHFLCRLRCRLRSEF